jgi:hypothetical protein
MKRRLLDANSQHGSHPFQALELISILRVGGQSGFDRAAFRFGQFAVQVG